jgi:hypothetical protein
MTRLFRSLALSGVALLIATTSVFAAGGGNPHYVTGPTVTLSSTSLTITGKVAGLGNITSVDASLTGTVDVFSRCYNKGGNKPQADNKQETINVNQDASFDVKNGTTTFSFSVSPLSTLNCPGNQVVVIESVSYDLFLTWPQQPSLDRHFVS